MIDFVIVLQCDLLGVRMTIAMRGAKCWTKYKLFKAVFNLYIAPQYRRTQNVRMVSFADESIITP